MLYYCFTAEVGSDSLVAFYDHGKTYPKCTNNVTSTLFTLQCAKGQDWDEGLHGNASTFLRFIRPSPEGPCLVCVCVLSVTRTHARTHAHTHTHTPIHTHTHAHTHLKIYPFITFLLLKVLVGGEPKQALHHSVTNGALLDCRMYRW